MTINLKGKYNEDITLIGDTSSNTTQAFFSDSCGMSTIRGNIDNTVQLLIEQGCTVKERIS